MKVGFTGTRKGMSIHQRRLFIDLLNLGKEHRPTRFGVLDEFHHGGCIGADEDAHHLVQNESDIPIYVHPCDIKDMQSKITEGEMVERLPEKKPLVRNHDIVDECDMLIAAPFTNDEVVRSGTWATVRYAKRKGKIVIILYNPQR